MWERKMCHPTSCGGPWVAFEKKAESIDRQESIHELSSKVYTATVDSGKSG